MTRRSVFIALCFVAIAWKAWRTDWIVECRYQYADTDPPPTVSYGKEFYYPPPSPIWSPPNPVKLTGRSYATWLEWEFFEGGGSWGPIEEPHLHVRWLMVIGKILAVCMPMYLFVFGIAEPRDKTGRSRRDQRS
jgi:hypothetical protein